MSASLERLRAELADRYAVERELGAGGSATVYLARDLKHGRPVALKVLRPELAAAVGTERFLQEIAVTARLQHPNILQLYDSGEVAGVPYYVTPWVEGESLRERLDRDGALPVETALHIARSVARALQYAHERGVVHRDVKPGNVLLQAGEPLVADFGVALALSEARQDRLTVTGMSVGTPRYMSPEQVAGASDVGPASDVYSLGALLYEMLAGRPPFEAETVPALVAAILSERPAPIRSLRPSVPPSVEGALARALEKEPGDRFSSASAFASALSAERPAASPLGRMGRRGKALLAAGVVAVAGLGGWWAVREAGTRADQRWARTEAIPEIQDLVERWENVEALHLAREARAYLPDDPTLAALIEAASVAVDVTSDPPGAAVSYRDYAPGEPPWSALGTTPLSEAVVPDQQLMLRFERDGYQPLELAVIPALGQVGVRLVPDTADDMVHVAAGTYALSREPTAVDSFRIDRLEVTHGDFRAFVEAGGYDDPEWWPALVDDGDTLDLAAATERFVDTTGRPGPSTWTLSRPPEGAGMHPVGGVSWFEAAAYCRWAGKELPTFYHWKHAAGVDVFANILELSNFAGEGPRPVGATGGVGLNGTLDQAGNVREWVWNETRGLRYILGGAWDSPEYMFLDRDAVDAWNREATNGFRCARYARTEEEDLRGPVEEPFFDFRGYEPVADDTYAFYETLFEYDERPLEARVLSADTTSDWIHERVDYTAAYPGERVPAHVFLPRSGGPPWQTVVYFPGSAARLTRSSENTSEMTRLMFLPRSGRALVFPVLTGMYERQLEEPPAGPADVRDLYVRVNQDVMRTVDYVVERDDLDADRLAYLGLSLGAELATPMALEKRFDALVLVGGGLDPAWRGNVPEEVAPWNYASRITTPTLLLNGRQDYMHPYFESQVPYFEAIDVPEEDKRFVVLETGHVPEWNDVIRYTLEWLDERLGPVVGRD